MRSQVRSLGKQHHAFCSWPAPQCIFWCACRLVAHMQSRPGSIEQVYVTQMMRPLAAAVDAALETYREEMVLYTKAQQAAAMRAAASRQMSR